MLKKEFSVVSDFDGIELRGILFEPENTPKGIIQFVYGMCEIKYRYEDLASFFAQNGYIAAVYDHRGHGYSVKTEEDLGWFNDRHGKAIVEDAVRVTKYLKTEYPNLPFTLFGHSMGSMVVRCYIREHDDLIDKLIVCGSPSSNPMAGIAVWIARLITLFCGERHRSNLLYQLSTGKAGEEFDKKYGSWLTRDEAIAKRDIGDTRYGFRFTCNGYENLFNLMKYTYKKKGYLVKNPALPIHFVSGSDDIVMGDELKWFQAIEFLRGVGYTQVSGKLYEGMRHEIYNEIGREEVYCDLLAFVDGAKKAE